MCAWAPPSSARAGTEGRAVPGLPPAALSLPTSARRLFPDLEVSDQPLEMAGSEDLVIRRLLEDGDRQDLTWLFATRGEARIRRWLAERGGRQLSRRSRLYWSRVLGLGPGALAPPSPIHDDLWLL